MREITHWEPALNNLVDRIGPRFARSEARQCAKEYLRGLLIPTPRKNGWQLAAVTGDDTPYRFQQFLYRSRWDPDALRNDLRTYVVESLSDANAVLVLDEAGFVKKGVQSAGVQYQPCGWPERVENCQIGLFLSYVSSRGVGFIDRTLFLPQEWLEDQERCQRAGIPEQITFRPKQLLAQDMLTRTRAAGVPFGCVTGSEIYGYDSSLRCWLETLRLGYVFPIAVDEKVFLNWNQYAVGDILKQLQATQWADRWVRSSFHHRLGQTVTYEWLCVPLMSPKIDGWKRRLLVHRPVGCGTELTPYLCFAPVDSTLAELVWTLEAREAAQASLEAARDEVGLDRYEVRTWTGWYRHITLACFAYTLLVHSCDVTMTISARPEEPAASPPRSDPT